MRVPFLDLAGVHRPIQRELMDALGKAIEGNEFILGPSVGDFEEAFAAYVGRRHCVALSSGTAALHLASLAVDMGPGDEVITTPFTWISTSWAISYCGATPVFADVEPTTGNLDPESVRSRITDRTRAILCVDLYGNPARLDTLSRIAASHGLALIDDACQAHGSQLLGRPVGSFGDLACFSFYPGKNLGALGEGGAVVTDDPSTAARLRSLRDHAQQGRHNHSEIGFNYRMEGFQGAALKVKLRRLDEWNAARSRAADFYLRSLSEIAGICLPAVTPGAESNWHLFVIHVADRDRLKDQLAERGIETLVHYPTPVHLQPAYSHLGYVRGDLPIAELASDTCLSLPISPVITPTEQRYVVETLAELLDRETPFPVEPILATESA